MHTWYPVPNGVPASINVGDHCILEAGSSFAPCVIDDQVYIGARSVISEGVKIGKGAILGPNTYVPPGRYIPSGQYWEGSPAKFVRECKDKEIYETYLKSYDNWLDIQNENNSSKDQKLNTLNQEQVKEYVSENYFKWRAKYYDV